MARLDVKKYPMPNIADYKGNIHGWIAECDKTIAKIPKNKLLQFPVADGYALYFIKSTKPLVLQHIYHLDGYEIPGAHVRGLRLEDVNYMISFRD